MEQKQLAPEVQDEISKTQDVIRGYANVMQEMDGISFYDISVLPHPKETIAKALLLAIKLSGDEHQRENLKGALGILTRFRENVGKNPVRPSPPLPTNDETTSEDLAKLFEAHKPEAERYALLQEHAKAEETAFISMVDTLLKM
ncbi:MAG: hypothetical protein ACAH80_08200 [Alphaproteobacteria bacterium]